MHRTSSAPIARSATILEQSARAPVLGLDSGTTMPLPTTTAERPLPTERPRKKAGGGGRGIARPKRKDPNRRDLMRTDSVQKASIQRALQSSSDSNERLRYCTRQRQTGVYSPTCPLSPPGRTRAGTQRWRSQTCTDERCECTLSYTSMALEHGLGSPSLVRTHAPGVRATTHRTAHNVSCVPTCCVLDACRCIALPPPLPAHR